MPTECKLVHLTSKRVVNNIDFLKFPHSSLNKCNIGVIEMPVLFALFVTCSENQLSFTIVSCNIKSV